MKFSGFLPAILFQLAFIGCLEPAAEEEKASPVSTETVTLTPITYEDWTSRIGEFKGQILVVDFWATWCAPCVERFPHMVELYKRYKDRGVQFASMCLDDRSESEAVEAARLFLQKNNAVFFNYLMDENILEAFEKLDLLGIPAVFIYDQAGEMRYRLTGDDPRDQFTEEDVEAAIEELLRQS
jgi:thiol-disulfide isomerase/thioredoxin